MPLFSDLCQTAAQAADSPGAMKGAVLHSIQEIFPGVAFQSVNSKKRREAVARLDLLAKPRDSLGRLEEIAQRLFAIAEGRFPLRVDPAVIYTVAADHGVGCRQVSPFPQAVTRQMVANFLAGGAAINALCKTFSIDLKVVDAGCIGGEFQAHPMLISCRLGEGTRDISTAEAMDSETALQALRDGLQIVRNGPIPYGCIGLGEMGIANTTSASALYCALFDLPAAQVVGPGCGAGQAMQRHKIRVVEKALALHAEAICSRDPLRILAALGGFEIAAIAGMMLGAASMRLPFVVDGFICTAAYAVARAIWAPLADYAFLAHNSAEPAYAMLMRRMEESPLLALNMRLGEGTGCALAINLLRAAAAIFNDVATLDDARVSATEADRID